ncbi:DUF7002 family protein [Rhodopirellula sallentina]|uniref:DUF7002 family protein n=1 Tax=Rhodopirellula sallentina TaxID=1263869 RepID=UPI0011817F46|nr:hypothetical protein [Rhodopirellula sallentina]
MAIDFTKLIDRTPFLFHLTYLPSLERIRRTMTLESAARLLDLGNKQEWLRKRREDMLRFNIGNDKIVLTDQRPLTAGNVDFRDGWEVGDLVEFVNRRVFFWRGDHTGLLCKDRGHFGTYNERGKQLVGHFVVGIEQQIGNRIRSDADNVLCHMVTDPSKHSLSNGYLVIYPVFIHRSFPWNF